MLIDCPECRREVSDAAPACPSCGYPLASPPPGREDMPLERRPSLFGSFVLGGAGGLIKRLGGLLFLVSCFGIAMDGPAARTWLIVSLVMIAWGAYAQYISRQTVRVTHKDRPEQRRERP